MQFLVFVTDIVMFVLFYFLSLISIILPSVEMLVEKSAIDLIVFVADFICFRKVER